MSYADKQSEKELAALEKRLKEVYKQAYKEAKIDSDAYFEEFKERYEREKAKWKAGEYTDDQFKAWCRTQLARGKSWNKLKQKMAEQYVKANQTAAEYINGTTPSVFAINANYAAYEINQQYVDASFDLVDENVVKNLIMASDNYTEFKTVSVNPKRDYEWNSKQIQTALTSGIIRGDSIEDIAQSFMAVQKRNYNAAVRNARTACTSAENAGRISTMKAAKEQGIDVRKRWLSAHDGRVRDSHAHLDGQIRDIDKAFDNGLMFPADSAGRPEEVYNCRCTLTYIYPKYDAGIKSREDYAKGKNGTETYKQWLNRLKNSKKNTISTNNNGILNLQMNLQFFADKDKQYGKKIGKHAQDFGLDVTKAADRNKMKDIIKDIQQNKTELRIGPWRGQADDVLFHINGNDVVLTKQDGEFITVLKDGVINSEGVKNARRIEF